MELVKETVLGAIIIELASAVEISATDFLVKYDELFGRYADCLKLRELLEDSQPAKNWRVIQKARKLALGRYKEKRNLNHPLCSIFSNLTLDGTYPIKKYYAPSILEMGDISPFSKIKYYDYEKYMQGFCNELDRLVCESPSDFNSFLILMDTLLKKYLWSIPASGLQDEDVSLYDYIRTVISIVAVLVQQEEKNVKDTPYIIVAGYFSGIQKYIFSVSRVGAGGVAKRLRARSFYINALISALAHDIIHKFELPIMNILMLTGGKFYILLPNRDDVEKELCVIEKRTTRFLYEKFRGNLSLELIWEKIADNGILDYSTTITILSQKIEEKKNRLLESVLINEKEWDTEQFIVYQDLYHKSMCKACKSALVEEEREMCSNCEIDTEIGGKLPKIKMFSFSRKKGQYKLLDDYYLNLDLSFGNGENYLIMKLNDSELTGMYAEPVSIYFAVNNVPLHADGEVKTFEEIADAAVGSKKLGIYKADVDTLGFLFSEGLKNENNEIVSISRISTLSHMLEMFFGGCIQHLIQSKYPNVYCVFSGGDDLFFIGPWNEMPLLALDINRKFHKYTGHNHCMTLSAAICMTERGEHISTLAEWCEGRLKEVKQKADTIISPEEAGRNGVYFLEKVMSWGDLEEQIAKGEKFVKAYSSVGTEILRRLGVYSNMYQAYLKDKNPDNLMFIPLFSRDMKHNDTTLNKDLDFKKYCEELYKNVSNYRRVYKQFYYVEFCVRYALLMLKEERTDGRKNEANEK